MADPVFELFDEYAARWARGERPDAREYLERAGEGEGELAVLIDRFLAAAPPPPPGEEARALVEAWAAGESPLLALRVRRGLKRDAVVDRLVSTLGLDPAKRAKVKRYYHELESGLLEPGGVDRRVWDVLAAALRARAGDLIGWRPPPVAARAAFLRAEEPAAFTPSRVPSTEDHEEPDEIDLLFHSGR